MDTLYLPVRYAIGKGDRCYWEYWCGYDSGVSWSADIFDAELYSNIDEARHYAQSIVDGGAWLDIHIVTVSMLATNSEEFCSDKFEK